MIRLMFLRAWARLYTLEYAMSLFSRRLSYIFTNTRGKSLIQIIVTWILHMHDALAI